MKITLLILLLLLNYSDSYRQTSTNSILAEHNETGRKCTGSAYCTACKNCTGCKHCAKEGGSCGVCSGSNHKTYTYPKQNSNSHTVSGSGNIYFKGEYLVIIPTTLNLREGPGTEHKILKELTDKSQLIYLERVGSWLKVKTKETETIGYVFYKYVKAI